jgi:cation diffusion facilitator CzcD-associated flavoprotein CzcO
MRLLGGIALEVDGKPVQPQDTLLYKGIMLSDVPNLVLVIGYTNASWTLKCDLASMYFCRVVRHTEEAGRAWFRPHLTDETVTKELLIDFSSSYVQRAKDRMPPQGSKAPWKLHQNYFRDRRLMGKAPVDDGVLEFG